VQGSEFFGHVAPADTVAAAEEFIDRVRTEYDDATHNVPAYRVPAGEASARTPGSEVMLREYSSDDGEPTGSAGKPALNVLQQRDIRNVVAVVTRYYGGTNLGVGGLARAPTRGGGERSRRGGRDRGATAPSAGRGDRVRRFGDRPRRDRVVGRRVRRRRRRVRLVLLRVPVAEVESLVERLNSATSGRVEIDR